MFFKVFHYLINIDLIFKELVIIILICFYV